MLTSTRIHVFTWLYKQSLDLTNWSRLQLAEIDAHPDPVDLIHSDKPQRCANTAVQGQSAGDRFAEFIEKHAQQAD